MSLQRVTNSRFVLVLVSFLGVSLLAACGARPTPKSTAKTGQLALIDELLPKGKPLAVYVIRNRGFEQTGHGNSVSLQEGDQFRVRLVLAEDATVSVGIVSGEGEWMPLAENQEFPAGIHMLSDAMAVTPGPVDSTLVGGFAEDVAEAHADGEYDHLEVVELHDRDEDDSAGGGDDPRLQWDGFNVHRDLIPQFRFLPTPPPTPTAEDGYEYLSRMGVRSCSGVNEAYMHSNSGEGSGASWGGDEAEYGWLIEPETTFASGQVIHLKAHCTGEGCDPEQESHYFHSNAEQGAGSSWGDRDAQYGWVLEFDGEPASGMMVHLQAQCTGDNCPEDVHQQYMYSNSAEEAGRSWGPKDNRYAWILEWTENPLSAPTPQTVVRLKAHCTGPASFWVRPTPDEEEEEEEDQEAQVASGECSPLMDGEELWSVLEGHGMVEGSPDTPALQPNTAFRGQFDSRQLMKWNWGHGGLIAADGAAANTKGLTQDQLDGEGEIEIEAQPNGARFDKANRPASWAVEAIVKHIKDGKCIDEGVLRRVVRILLPTHPHGGLFVAGDDHTCRVTNDGRATCWGDNRNGQSSVPPGIYKSIATGGQHSCALTVYGRARCWGNNSHGQTMAPGDTEFRTIFAGHNSTCAVDYGGSPTCWGAVDSVPEDVDGLVQVSVGASHACAVDEESGMHCWGSNGQGELNAPEAEWDEVFAGEQYTCAMQSRPHTVRCWGDPRYSIAMNSPGGSIAMSGGATSGCVSAGWFDGGFNQYNKLFCWGAGEHVGTQPNEEFGYWLAVGRNHACARTRFGGKIVCWGNDEYGQTQVPPQYSRIVLGQEHICGLSGNRVQCGGDGSRGQRVPSPPHSGNGADFSPGRIAAGLNHTCGVRAGGVDCWGDNTKGQLNGAPAASADKWADLGAWLDAGTNHTCRIKGGAVDCWGDNEFGQTDVPEGEYAAIALGDNHSCGRLKSANDWTPAGITCWGKNDQGQITAPDGLYESVWAGGNTTCATTPSPNGNWELAGPNVSLATLQSRFVCWGANDQGQASVPIAELHRDKTINWKATVGGLQLAMSGDRTCMTLRSSLGSRVACWGRDGLTQHTVQTNVSHLSMRGDAVCVTETTGEGYCWGEHRAKTYAPPQIVDAGEHSEAINAGIAAFRHPDAAGNSCASCHAPDGLDLVFADFDEGDWIRRVQGHVPASHVDPIMGMLQAHRDRYSWAPTIQFTSHKPLQPGVEALSGDTAGDRDAAFAQQLADRDLIVATQSIDSYESASQARDQLLALDIRQLPIGFEFHALSEDAVRGESYKSSKEWTPALGMIPVAGKTYTLLTLENEYLADPTDAKFANLIQAHLRTDDPILKANTDVYCGGNGRGPEFCDGGRGVSPSAGNFDVIERQRLVALLIASHEMRRTMMGLPPRPAGQPLPYPTGAIWNTGALAEASGLDCKAKNPEFDELWNVSWVAKKACAILPNPWNSEGKPWKDLTEFGLPWRWAGFMMNPILVTDLGDMSDPEPSTGAKLNALGKNLSDGQYHSHHAFMILYHRVHKFFGSDQSWRTRGQGMNDAAVRAEFTSMPGIGQPNFRSEEHQQVHQLLVQNLAAMMQQLSQEL